LIHGEIEGIRKESIQEAFQKAKTILSSVIISHSIHKVINHNVLNMIHGNIDRIKDNKKRTMRKKKFRNPHLYWNCDNTTAYQVG
jgi:hypothetical protein